MKALSIRQPWASLLRQGTKKIETRSFKTNYRGQLYLHASKRKLTKQEKTEFAPLLALLKEEELVFGVLVAKCNLVDCIKMDETYVDNIKNNYPLEYQCGIYQEGRYAWILEEIQPLQKLTKVKGSLGIFKVKDEVDG